MRALARAAAAAGVVATHRFEPWAAVALVLAVSAYEIGDYLVGSGARNALEGPIAGAVAVLVVQFAVAAVGLPPFELENGLAFAALAAVLCPLGQLVAIARAADRRRARLGACAASTRCCSSAPCGRVAAGAVRRRTQL